MENVRIKTCNQDGEQTLLSLSILFIHVESCSQLRNDMEQKLCRLRFTVCQACDKVHANYVKLLTAAQNL